MVVVKVKKTGFLSVVRLVVLKVVMTVVKWGNLWVEETVAKMAVIMVEMMEYE